MKKCLNCGVQINDDSVFCTECGKELPKGIVCPHCGISVNDGDSFCQNCGKKIGEISSFIPSESSQKRCPHCGTALNNDVLFCENCGHKLSENNINLISEDHKQQSYIIREDSSNTIKFIIPIVIGIIVLAIIGGGFWYYTQRQNFNHIDKDDKIEVEQNNTKSYDMFGSVSEYPITMHLEIDGNHVNGFLYYNRIYNKIGADAYLTISGSYTDGVLNINEIDKNGVPTGHYQGNLQNGTYKGEFISNKGDRLPFIVATK